MQAGLVLHYMLVAKRRCLTFAIRCSKVRKVKRFWRLGFGPSSSESLCRPILAAFDHPCFYQKVSIEGLAIVQLRLCKSVRGDSATFGGALPRGTVSHLDALCRDPA